MRLPVTLFFFATVLHGSPRFLAPAKAVDTFQYAEVTVETDGVTGNPFVDARLTGRLQRDGGPTLSVSGFCDSPDGKTYRIRFLATQPGRHQYSVEFENAGRQSTYQGDFEARPSSRRGLLQVDPDAPHHFLWSGTGEHYFWNGLTTYALLGWKDDAYIRAIVDRAAEKKINHLRVTLNGPRVDDASRWYEPVKPSSGFRFLFGPWVGAHPDDVHNPAWDVTRFDTEYWRKYERAVEYAREKNVVISVIFFLDGEDSGADPFGKANAFGADERRYYEYAAARLAAFSNVVWDITNEWHLFRDAWWVERMGTFLKSADPYGHLASCHGRGEFPWMLSPWANFAMFQLWDESGAYEPMLQRRLAQDATGRPMPQVNEEYGYEDHYPVKWGGNRRPPARSGDNRRRLAWEITMAGCYQTTGERANRGDGNAPATPGGWINGGFDSSMVMLDGYAHMVGFFESFPYWKLVPMPQAAVGVRLLGEQGTRYVVYQPEGAEGTVKLAAGKYRVQLFDPRTGERSDGGEIEVAQDHLWTVPPGTRGLDRALLIER